MTEISIRLNGEDRSIPASLTVGALIEHFGLKRGLTIVERNGAIVPKESYDNIEIAGGDTLEMVRFVGGG